MKNTSDSYLSTSQSYQHKPQEYLFELEDDRSGSALTKGLYHQVEDWVALELTAEQMLGDRLDSVTAYAANDARQMWDAVKKNLLPYELAAGQLLLQAADPTQVEWLQHHWWDGEDSAQH
ncbi:hypothetical protein GCM10011613_26660 [Cellvibrio zantedeschiae]|uniref:Uncharacterized protein n=1 Tax=Cellvibrio zantedeschiae TaxID=1237077 RepID=A0ABQ3B9S5_9GAMM|nr:hypothetical protein [Cellvibrio zantedeschiae]GGY80298.1 hypothetical protein GCM10011613_26660 [Cellvibrio zantedeschiae]